MYWNFGYDPQTDTITVGPHIIEISATVNAARALADSIYLAARAVDARAAVELRARTVESISAAESLSGSLGDAVRVSLGLDNKVWVSLDSTLPNDDGQRVSGLPQPVESRRIPKKLMGVVPVADDPVLAKKKPEWGLSLLDLEHHEVWGAWPADLPTLSRIMDFFSRWSV